MSLQELLILWQLPIEDYRVSSLRSYRKQSTSYLQETNTPYYDAYDKGFIIEDKKDETLEDKCMKVDVQVIQYHQLPNINKSNDVNNNLCDYMNQEVEVGVVNHMQMKCTIRECSF